MDETGIKIGSTRIQIHSGSNVINPSFVRLSVSFQNNKQCILLPTNVEG